MRTTVTLDEDVASAVIQMQRDQGVGVSTAVNQLIRGGLLSPKPSRSFLQRTSMMRARIDVTNVADALELLDGPSAP